MLGYEMGQGGMHQTEHAIYIDANQLIPGIRIAINDVSREVDACICQHDVEPSKLAQRALDNGADLPGTCHVCRGDQDFCVDFIRQCIQPFLGARSYDEPYSIPGEFACNGASDSRACASDDSNFVLERLSHDDF